MQRQARLCGPTSDQLAEYVHQIRAYPLLTACEERELTVRFHSTGCERSRERLICANLRLVLFAAKRFVGRGVPLPDLVEAGNIGLMRAVLRFDPGKGTRLSTYAVYCIRQEIIKEIQDHGGLIRMPREAYRMRRRCTAARRQLAELGQPVSERDVALATGLSVLGVRRSDRAERARRIDTGRATEDGPVIPDTTGPQPWAALDGRELGALLARHMASLPVQEGRVISLCYGLDGGDPMTVSRIGRELGLTREHTQRLLRAGLDRLRMALAARPATGHDRVYAAGAG